MTLSENVQQLQVIPFGTITMLTCTRLRQYRAPGHREVGTLGCIYKRSRTRFVCLAAGDDAGHVNTSVTTKFRPPYHVTALWLAGLNSTAPHTAPPAHILDGARNPCACTQLWAVLHG